MSINKAQAEALAAGFLDTKGDSKDGFEPRETLSELILLAGEFIEDAQKNLKRSGSIASGKLSESLIAGEPVSSGSVISVDILMNFYGQFINKGVKGTKSGQGQYSFKNEFPSRKMVDAIREWIKHHKLATATIKTHAFTRHQKKAISVSSLASPYAVARSVKQHGINKTGFIDKAAKTTSAKVSSRLGQTFKIDIIDFLTTT